jgi:hypothetical protein
MRSANDTAEWHRREKPSLSRVRVGSAVMHDGMTGRRPKVATTVTRLVSPPGTDDGTFESAEVEAAVRRGGKEGFTVI